MSEKILYGLNGSTTQPLDQETELRLAGAAGFDLIEFRAPKIEAFLQRGTPAELRRLAGDAGLKPLSINSLEQTDTRPESEVLSECEKLADRAAALGCPYLVAVPGFTEQQLPESETVARVAERLRRLAEACGERGVKLGFEFLGFSDCTVNRLTTARKIVQAVANTQNQNIGLVLDTCHFYLSGEPVDQLREFGPGELLILHVNDVEDRPRAELRDPHRLLPGRGPGQGIVPLREYWAALREANAVNHASLELFRPEYWQREPEAFLTEAIASLRKIFV